MKKKKLQTKKINTLINSNNNHKKSQSKMISKNTRKISKNNLDKQNLSIRNRSQFKKRNNHKKYKNSRKHRKLRKHQRNPNLKRIKR